MPSILIKFAAALFATLMLAIPAHAYVFSFNFSAADHNHNITGTITTANTLDAVGAYDILGITGTVSGTGGGAITGLVSNPDQPYVDWNDNNLGYWYDNVLHASAPYLDWYGVLFTAGGNIWNLYSNSASDSELYSYTANGGVDVHGTYAESLNTNIVVKAGQNPSELPEPGSLALVAFASLIMALTYSKQRRLANAAI